MSPLKTYETIIIFGIFITQFPQILSSFGEYAIFEEEDIYKRALPSDPTSNGLTIPGTKWCGPGDTARNYNDLGIQKETDKCCRAHDNCDDVILSKQRAHGLENPDLFTRLSCDCEQAFLNCLQNVNNYASIAMGKAYFTLRKLCFKNEYPAVECVRYQEGMIRKRCVRYKFDNTRQKQWQWFHIPYFTI